MLDDSLKQIPDTDAEEALIFCRELKRFLCRHGKDGIFVQSAAPLSKPGLSLVIPVFNESSNLNKLVERIVPTLSALNLTYELIFVDDGSIDSSVETLIALREQNPSIVIVELARNFGHQAALSAGLEHSQGDAVILLDADLQDPPEAISQFIQQWNEGYQVVYAYRIKRKEGPLLRTAYALFYRLLRVVADVKIPIDAGDFCLMDRQVVDVIRSMPERHRFLRGLRSWVGFKQIGIPIERDPRFSGDSGYSWGKLVTLALDGLIAFTIKPLRLISFFGIAVSIGSVLLAIFYSYQRVAMGLTPPGFATIVVLLSLFAGVQLITVGLIGEYVGRIFDETRQRPLYVVKKLTKAGQ